MNDSHSVRLLFFSLLQDITGSAEMPWIVPENGLTVEGLLQQLFIRWPALRPWEDRLLIAIDLDYADRQTQVRPGQEVALMPPVQGG